MYEWKENQIDYGLDCGKRKKGRWGMFIGSERDMLGLREFENI